MNIGRRNIDQEDERERENEKRENESAMERTTRGEFEERLTEEEESILKNGGDAPAQRFRISMSQHERLFEPSSEEETGSHQPRGGWSTIFTIPTALCALRSKRRRAARRQSHRTGRRLHSHGPQRKAHHRRTNSLNLRKQNGSAPFRGFGKKERKPRRLLQENIDSGDTTR